MRRRQDESGMADAPHSQPSHSYSHIPNVEYVSTYLHNFFKKNLIERVSEFDG